MSLVNLVDLAASLSTVVRIGKLGKRENDFDHAPEFAIKNQPLGLCELFDVVWWNI